MRNETRQDSTPPSPTSEDESWDLQFDRDPQPETPPLAFPLRPIGMDRETASA